MGCGSLMGCGAKVAAVPWVAGIPQVVAMQGRLFRKVRCVVALLRLSRSQAFVSISDETNVASRSQFLNAALHGCDGLAREVEHISRDGHAVYVAQRLLSNTSIE